MDHSRRRKVIMPQAVFRRIGYSVSISLLSLMYSAHAVAQVSQSPRDTAHYYDPLGQPIARYDAVWSRLAASFGTALPTRITVYSEGESQSVFDVHHTSIAISKASLRGKGPVAPKSENALVAHETVHLALAALSGGASNLEPFRFLDEGLAVIVQKTIDGELPEYKRAAIVIAGERLSKNNVGLAAMQQWSAYFGDGTTKADYDAYAVGSAFDFFLQDTYGDGAVQKLFADLGKTRSLARSLETVFGRTFEEVEHAWQEYLRAAMAAAAPPRH